MKQYYIYKILDQQNEPIYIGQTCNLRRRRNEHLWPKRDCYIHRKIRKMCQDPDYNFALITIEVCQSLDEANTKEIYWIQTLREQEFHLCNLTDGGNGTPGYKPIFTPEWRSKLSNSARRRQLLNPSFKDKRHSKESKDKMSINHKDVSGPGNPFFGKKHTEEFKQKLSLERKGIGKKQYKITSPDGLVYFVTEGLNAFCLRPELLSFNLSPSGLSSVATGRYKSHKGWLVEYY